MVVLLPDATDLRGGSPGFHRFATGCWNVEIPAVCSCHVRPIPALAVALALPWLSVVTIAQSFSPPERDDGRQWLKPGSTPSSPLAVASRATALNQNNAAEKLLRRMIRQALRSPKAAEAQKLLSGIYIRPAAGGADPAENGRDRRRLLRWELRQRPADAARTVFARFRQHVPPLSLRASLGSPGSKRWRRRPSLSRRCQWNEGIRNRLLA